MPSGHMTGGMGPSETIQGGQHQLPALWNVSLF
jgi:hypothetical protein